MTYKYRISNIGQFFNYQNALEALHTEKNTKLAAFAQNDKNIVRSNIFHQTSWTSSDIFSMGKLPDNFVILSKNKTNPSIKTNMTNIWVYHVVENAGLI